MNEIYESEDLLATKERIERKKLPSIGNGQDQLFLAEPQRSQSIFFPFKNSAFSAPLRGRLSLGEPGRNGLNHEKHATKEFMQNDGQQNDFSTRPILILL